MTCRDYLVLITRCQQTVLWQEHAQTTEFSVWHLNGQYLQNYCLNLSGFDMCIWSLSITGCRWIRSSFSENNQRTPLQRVECGRKDCFPSHGKRGDDDYNWLNFSIVLPQMFRRGISAESDLLSSSYQCSLFELPAVVLFLCVCFLPPVYGKLCKQCIFMVLKFFIKCGDIDLLKTYDTEKVLGLSNHDLKKILESWFSVQFLFWMISWV